MEMTVMRSEQLTLCSRGAFQGQRLAYPPIRIFQEEGHLRCQMIKDLKIRKTDRGSLPQAFLCIYDALRNNARGPRGITKQS